MFNTELELPNGFGTASAAFGSAIHCPSTTKRYSYCPLGSAIVVFHASPFFWRGVFFGSQSLNVPATDTDFAWVMATLNCTSTFGSFIFPFERVSNSCTTFETSVVILVWRLVLPFLAAEFSLNCLTINSRVCRSRDSEEWGLTRRLPMGSPPDV